MDPTALLVAAGLSEHGVLRSTGWRHHIERIERNVVSSEVIVQYGSDLRAIQEAFSAGGGDVPIDYWDENDPGTKADGSDLYALVHRLSQPEFREYLGLLGRSYQRLRALKEGSNETAVAAALAILCESSTYVTSGSCLEMARVRAGMSADQHAIFLWQQILTGTNRQIPYIHRDAYSHGPWARFNVVEMWRYQARSDLTPDEVWGLSGFADRYVGDATNTNQIEHMAISAVAQMVLALPQLLLDVVEELEWILRKGTRAASKADERLNRAIARVFQPRFRAEAPQAACQELEKELARD